MIFGFATPEIRTPDLWVTSPERYRCATEPVKVGLSLCHDSGSPNPRISNDDGRVPGPQVRPGSNPTGAATEVFLFPPSALVRDMELYMLFDFGDGTMDIFHFSTLYEYNLSFCTIYILITM